MKKILLVVLLFGISLSGYCQPDMTVIIKADEYSGVYEGTIDYSLCCEAFDSGEGFIVFDFSENPYRILYDGVFVEGLILEKNTLKVPDEYSYYPKNIMGMFESKNGVPGFLYNFQTPENETASEKSFLKKTGDINKAKELIKKYGEEKNKFDEFWYGFKQTIIQKDYKKMSMYSILPLYDSSDYAMTTSFKTVLATAKEVEGRLKKIFNDVINNSYPIDWEENRPWRYEDHYPAIPGGGVYMMQVYLASLVFNKVGDEFKLVKILYTWG